MNSLCDTLKTKTALIVGIILVTTAFVAMFVHLRFGNHLIAQVGNFKIYKLDVKKQNQVTHLFYPNAAKDIGLSQLTKSFTHADILKNNGVEITELMLRKEERRIDDNTRSPQTLQKLKGIFKDDDEAYRRVFILPLLADRMIHSFFMNNPRIQESSRKKAEEFIEVLRLGPQNGAALISIDKLAKKSDYTVKTVLVSYAEGIEWEDPNQDRQALRLERSKHIAASRAHSSETSNVSSPTGPDSKAAGVPPEVQQAVDNSMQFDSVPQAKRWIDDFIRKLKAGEVYSAPVERNEEWLVFQMIRQTAHDPLAFELKVVTIPKLDYNQWLENEKAKVAVRYARPETIAPKNNSPAGDEIQSQVRSTQDPS